MSPQPSPEGPIALPTRTRIRTRCPAAGATGTTAPSPDLSGCYTATIVASRPPVR